MGDKPNAISIFLGFTPSGVATLVHTLESAVLQLSVCIVVSV